MKTYLVGGAVRDALLQLPVGERDWVVVGATPDEMIARHFKPVGRDFPVFLHPDTGEEYALARLERKVAPGYHGFVTEFAPSVTLEEDLKRRDLTINAMAQDEQGHIIDPYGGREDLSRRILRHVSTAFVEDPVRILRVARFLSRFAPLGFQVAPDTLALMQQMIDAGEADALVPERIWRELERLLMATTPAAGVRLLQDCGAWRRMLPELETGCFKETTLTALQTAVTAGAPCQVRFAVLLNELSASEIERCCERWRVPTDYRELAVLLKRLQKACTELGPNAEHYLNFIESADAFRRPERFADLLTAIKALEQNSRGVNLLTERLQHALDKVRPVKLTRDEMQGLAGPALGEALRAKRLHALQQQ